MKDSLGRLIAVALAVVAHGCQESSPGSEPGPSSGGRGGGAAAGSGGGGGGSAGKGGASAAGSGGTQAPGSGGAVASGGAGGGSVEDAGGTPADAVDAPGAGGAGDAPASDAPAGAGFRIYWIDAEGGAATLLIAPTGETLLADTGWGGNRDVGRIGAVMDKELGKRKLDYFVATHYHVDHVGGAGNLAAAMPVANFVDHGASVEGGGDFNTYRNAVMNAMGGAKRISVQPGMKFMLGEVEITIVTAARQVAQLPTAVANPACAGASAPGETADEDPQSVGFVARFGRFDFVDLGDLTGGVEHKLACPMNQVGPVEVFQASQHGSSESNPVTLLRGLAPQVVVFNNGATKGGDGAIFERCKNTPGVKDIWSLHRKTSNSAAQNAPDELTANLAGPDMAHFIRANVQADGSFTITNGRTNMARSYTAQ